MCAAIKSPALARRSPQQAGKRLGYSSPPPSRSRDCVEPDVGRWPFAGGAWPFEASPPPPLPFPASGAALDAFDLVVCCAARRSLPSIGCSSALGSFVTVGDSFSDPSEEEEEEDNEPFDI